MNTSLNENVFRMLNDCMRRGAQVTLKLANGDSIARFRTIDIIMPVNIANYLVAERSISEFVVRGIEKPDHGKHLDHQIKMQDIMDVQDERSFPYFVDNDLRRFPIPDGWKQRARASLRNELTGLKRK